MPIVEFCRQGMFLILAEHETTNKKKKGQWYVFLNQAVFWPDEIREKSRSYLVQIILFMAEMEEMFQYQQKSFQIMDG